MPKTLIKTTGAISAGTCEVTFVDGTSDVVFDNTYSVYEFHFYNLHPSAANPNFQFQVNATDDAGGAYDTSLITSTFFYAYQSESGAASALAYSAGNDAAQSASFINLQGGTDNANDASASGVFTIYDPSSTTYVKHWMCRTNLMSDTPASFDHFTAGYINDTTAIDEISFKFVSGNIDAGTIKMFGVS